MQQQENSDRTWTKKRLGIIIAVAVIYGIWFNLLDSVTFCPPSQDHNTTKCTSNPPPPPFSIGEIFGGMNNSNQTYQPWNIAGHFIPGLFMFFFKPKKIELFLAAVLISTVVMDSPLWGVERIVRHYSLWKECTQHSGCGNNGTQKTDNLWEWIMFYYNPVGTKLVWDHGWYDSLPNAAMIFWSLIGRLFAAFLLIWWQERIEEKEDQELSLKEAFRRRRRT
jgi:hypothetical protein